MNVDCLCQNGTCGSDTSQCDCSPGYSGVLCDTCSLNCQNGGTLVNTATACECTCPSTYGGLDCASEFIIAINFFVWLSSRLYTA